MSVERIARRLEVDVFRQHDRQLLAPLLRRVTSAEGLLQSDSSGFAAFNGDVYFGAAAASRSGLWKIPGGSERGCGAAPQVGYLAVPALDHELLDKDLADEGVVGERRAISAGAAQQEAAAHDVVDELVRQLERASQDVLARNGMAQIDHVGVRRDPIHHAVTDPHERIGQPVVGEEDDRPGHAWTGR